MGLFLLQLDLATTGKGGVGPFIGICAIVACFGIADAHVQGGMVGDLSFMCPEFIQVIFKPFKVLFRWRFLKVIGSFIKFGNF